MSVHFKTLVAVQNGIIASTRALELSYIDVQQIGNRHAVE